MARKLPKTITHPDGHVTVETKFDEQDY
jgi:hypothetical protein